MNHHTLFNPLLSSSAALSSLPSSSPDFPFSVLSSSVSRVLAASVEPVHASAALFIPGHGLGPGVGSPVSNTGGNSSLDTLVDRFPVHVDWLTFSISTFVFDGDVGRASRYLERWTGGLFTIGGATEKRYNGYSECFLIIPVTRGESPFLGWVGLSQVSDNMRGRWCFCLTGAATSAVFNWSNLVSDMFDLGGRITRVDLALDDLDGIHPLSECESLYDAGAFNPPTGRPPKCKTIRHKCGTAGDTLYVGSRDSGKQFRCYEKGKQLGEVTSTWTRYESELLQKDRCIPWDILLLPAQYLKGLYPVAFKWMNATANHLQVLKEKNRISYERAQRWLKQQGGRLICFMREVMEFDEVKIVSLLSADSGRYPQRLFDASRHCEIPWPVADGVS